MLEGRDEHNRIMSAGKAGTIKLTMQQLGAQSKVEHMAYVRRFEFMTKESARNSSIADAAAAEKMGRPLVDFGMFLQVNDGGREGNGYAVYLRRRVAVDHSQAAMKPGSKQPAKELSTAEPTMYPPALRAEFMRLTARGVSAGPMPIVPVDEPRSTAFTMLLVGADHETLAPGDAVFWRASQKEQATCHRSAGPMRRTVASMNLRNATQLDMQGEPRGAYADGVTDGPYSPFVQQKAGGSVKPLNETTCPLLVEHYVHDPKCPLLVTSPQRGELLYVPNVLSLEHLWSEALSPAERITISKLSRACTSAPALLALRLNEFFTVEQAIASLDGNTSVWFHGCIHLRWTLQCVGACAAIHNFPQKRRKKVARDGTVIDPGTVTLVYSPDGPDHKAKAAFLTLVKPLAKMAQAALSALPEEKRPPVMHTINLDLLDGIDYAYTSLKQQIVCSNPGLEDLPPTSAQTYRPTGTASSGAMISPHACRNGDGTTCISDGTNWASTLACIYTVIRTTTGPWLQTSNLPIEGRRMFASCAF